MVWPSDIERSLAIFTLGASRTLPLSLMIPTFGGPALPMPIRLGLGLGLAVLCFPVIALQPVPSGAVGWTVLLFREVFVGVVMGFVVACLFHAVEAAGRVTDVLRGANLAEVMSPLSDDRSTPLGSLFLLLAIVVFWEMGGAGYLITALARSYEAIPLTAGAPSLGVQRAAILVVAASAKLIESALALAAPAVVALLIADLTLGALGRASPNLPLFFVGMPAKALLGVGMVLLGLGTLDAALGAGLRGFQALLERAASFGP
jgi:type III secretion protein SpaR/YscT/HrcT